ncbi:unnamed protein product (macronuclear) [Paramecium tetraurelia]|uniref:DEAD/DEAH box helicase domain-containing protein n=1 Tax=Paramecium tetraurelia TaxID=5888 RepID=A0BMQ2_PARTE|nr:uncharacterized protein GSPATT00030455001 [Paramecium tetraurelia]CAK59819.1 unnamed protein product [Paramecium tetraurelia]|eukprot:XP_001427217.1 hypothetical protein (macronuclear) [Paramecium tetraurelia strain d4-2]
MIVLLLHIKHKFYYYDDQLRLLKELDNQQQDKEKQLLNQINKCKNQQGDKYNYLYKNKKDYYNKKRDNYQTNSQEQLNNKKIILIGRKIENTKSIAIGKQPKQNNIMNTSNFPSSKSRDVLGVTNTGSGKTFDFLVSALELLKKTNFIKKNQLNKYLMLLKIFYSKVRIYFSKIFGKIFITYYGIKQLKTIYHYNTVRLLNESINRKMKLQDQILKLGYEAEIYKHTIADLLLKSTSF